MQNSYNQFYHGKSEEVLPTLEDIKGRVDLVFTSPPYADQRFYGTDDSKINPDEYVKWFLPKADAIYQSLRDGGNFILNINDKTVKGEQHLYVFELLIALKKEIGFNFVRDYIWHNPATPPNIFSRGKNGRTKKSHEYCFWLSKGSDWTFNMDPIRKPYSKDMQKFLDGNGKGDRSLNKRPSTHSFDCEKTWNNNGGSDPGSVITLGNTNSNDAFSKMCREKGITHPARFPTQLAEFFILSGSNTGDLVLDPFMGSGTTALVAQNNDRNWIGIDANLDYCTLAKQRLELEFPDQKIKPIISISNDIPQEKFKYVK